MTIKYKKIPTETIRRFPVYLRAMLLLPENQEYIDSKTLAEALHLNSPQIRKDFSYFGAFGTKGVGYKIETLTEQIRSILKLDTMQKTALVGAGRLGVALASYPGFGMYGLDIAMIFDSDPAKFGQKIGNITIQDAGKLGQIAQNGIKLAILAVPAEKAQETADLLITAGVSGILNLSPCFLMVPKKVKVITIDIAMELGTLPYYI